MSRSPLHVSRRRAMASVGAVMAVAWRPAHALSNELASMVSTFTGGAPTKEGRVTFDIAALVENGNTVPVTITVQSPMTAADHVQAIAIFNEKNPQHDVIVCRLSPASGRASFSTRIRLATSQQLIAVAKLSDGSYWTQTADVVVTVAACIE